ncbi:hypothetical protein TSUD_84620 [Trifolium subterraneum]|uniref:Uncharacterized protein n=1 Tax=Trifolium subterraneum TaxID=3900 RepID=A0A2Z6PA54_TRISU|nr:hypothetical protein TSUD_84620 [Trifolium subterraneum]
MEVLMGGEFVTDLLWSGGGCDGSMMGVVAAAGTDLSWRCCEVWWSGVDVEVTTKDLI